MDLEDIIKQKTLGMSFFGPVIIHNLLRQRRQSQTVNFFWHKVMVNVYEMQDPTALNIIAFDLMLPAIFDNEHKMTDALKPSLC